jgi:hypothetical protein
MHRWLALASFAASSWLPAIAAAAPIELVEQRDSYMIFRDVDGSIENADWFAREPFYAAYNDVEAGFLAAHPDDSQFLIVLSTWQLPPPVGALYQSVANDVQGIGYEHIATEDPIIPDAGNGYFDDTPNSQVQGFLHMNTWTNYLGDDPGGVDHNYISLVFGQEIGHAWLAFVHFQQGGGGSSGAMLGRANAHWSFYLSSGGSPVEGHEWIDNGDGTFTALKQDIYEFSDLDLYLMGLLPPEEVEPWFLLENVSNCVDSAAMDGSCAPPEAFLFQADQYTVNATRRDITIEDVIAAEGPRVPAFPEAPNAYDISFVLITRAGEELDEGSKLQIDAIVGRAIEIFDDQTRGYAHIVNRTDPDQGGDTTGGDEDTDADAGSADDTADDTSVDGGTGDDATAGPSSASGASGATVGDDGSATGDGGESSSAGASTEGGGCGCTHGRKSPWSLAACLGLGALARRRRPNRRIGAASRRLSPGSSRAR